MVQIDQSCPQQWSKYFTAAHMGFPPPTGGGGPPGGLK